MKKTRQYAKKDRHSPLRRLKWWFRERWRWFKQLKCWQKVLLIAGLLGSLGHSLKFLLHEGIGLGLITSTLSGTVLIGLLGIILAHRVHTPPVVFTMPACITMIPGLYAYRTMLGFIKLTDESGLSRTTQDLENTVHYFVLTASLLFTLAIGISIGVLLFRQDSVKMLKFVSKKNKS